MPEIKPKAKEEKIRPKTLEVFVLKMKELGIYVNEDNPILTSCQSCQSEYPLVYKDLTEGYCPSCAMEVFYDNIKAATQDIHDMDDESDKRERTAHASLSYRQRMGHRHTNS